MPRQVWAARPLRVKYALAKSARQGGELWYTIVLSAMVRFPNSQSEKAILSATTDGATAAQVVLESDGRSVTASTLGYVSGRRFERSNGMSAHIAFENYLQLQGVRPGINLLEIAVETIRGSAPDTVRILPETGIRVTRIDPYELHIEPPHNLALQRSAFQRSLSRDTQRQSARWPGCRRGETHSFPRGSGLPTAHDHQCRGRRIRWTGKADNRLGGNLCDRPCDQGKLQ